DLVAREPVILILQPRSNFYQYTNHTVLIYFPFLEACIISILLVNMRTALIVAPNREPKTRGEAKSYTYPQSYYLPPPPVNCLYLDLFWSSHVSCVLWENLELHSILWTKGYPLW